jgi:dihydrofolate reductase
MKWKMIVAMDEERVIGLNERLPWRIPEDIAWYQSQTDGQLMLMGRKTFESIRRRPEGSRYIVLSRSLNQQTFVGQAVTVIRHIDELQQLNLSGEGWVCGGATLYQQMLPHCEELYLSEVKGKHIGDAHFPKFEEHYELNAIKLEHEAFTVKHYVNRRLK